LTPKNGLKNTGNTIRLATQQGNHQPKQSYRQVLTIWMYSNASASATVRFANAVKFACITHLVSTTCWPQCPLTTSVIIAAMSKLTDFCRHYKSTTHDQVHQKKQNKPYSSPKAYRLRMKHA